MSDRYEGRACYACGVVTGIEPWTPPWHADAVWAKYAHCTDMDACKARVEKRRARTAQRQVRLILDVAPDPSDQPGMCRWCGLTLALKKDGTMTRRLRCEPRYEGEGRNCVRAYARSSTYDARYAIQIRDMRDHGAVVCADCGVECVVAADETWRHLGKWHEVTEWDADHEIPLEDGGPPDLHNLRCRCRPCHRRKTGRENSARAARRTAIDEAQTYVDSGQLSVFEASFLVDIA